MALSQKKLSKAVKDAQKQAEAAVADMRSQIDDRLPDVTVDPTPFFAVVGAATIAVDTVRHARDELQVAAKQARTADVRKGAKEAKQLQKDIQKRLDELQTRTAELRRWRRSTRTASSRRLRSSRPGAQPGAHHREQRQGPVRRRRGAR